MIVPEKRTWIRIVFYVTGTALVRVRMRLFTITAVAVAVTVVNQYYKLFETMLTATPFTLVGLALSIFLGFRNNTSYAFSASTPWATRSRTPSAPIPRISRSMPCVGPSRSAYARPWARPTCRPCSSR